MPAISTYRQVKPIKMLLLGDSGAGKTGALKSLAEAGYKLRIIDFDNGLGWLANNITGEVDVDYKTFTDPLRLVGSKIVPAKAVPDAFSRFLNALDKWTYEDGSSEKAADWGSDHILVIDSLTFMSDSAMRLVLAQQGRSGAQPFQSDWGDAMRLIEHTLNLLYDETIKCNIIVIAHVTFQEMSDGLVTTQRAYPNTLGNKLPPKVPRFFNTMLLAQSRTMGKSTKRIIHTQSFGGIELKHEAKGNLAPELPLETGLATFFKEVRGQHPHEEKK